jgi:SpoVK/Ycf46/Vps4 family AAA+-type ATPase
LLSRFEEQIEVGLPGPEERRKLFKLFLSKQRTDFDTDALAAELAVACGEISGRDIQSLVRRASRRAMQRGLKAGTLTNLVLTRDDVMSQFTGSRAEGASHV